jgi:tetratricopeptide (TPR) repeat protein
MGNGGHLKLRDYKILPTLIAWPIALLAMLHGASAVAQRQYDPKQLAMLPPYCKYTQLYRDNVPGGNDPHQIERWGSILGAANFHHLHHYCFGLENTNRALYFTSTKQERNFELSQSVREFDYVLERVPPDFPLLPEILTRRGENLLRLGNGPQGVLDLNRAIELKPDHWPPYAALSDYYKALGDVASAREWAEKGLSAAPGTKALQRRLAELEKTKAGQTSSTN